MDCNQVSRMTGCGLGSRRSKHSDIGDIARICFAFSLHKYSAKSGVSNIQLVCQPTVSSIIGSLTEVVKVTGSMQKGEGLDPQVCNSLLDIQWCTENYTQ